MEYQKLGSSDLNVSRICLGSMTWGEQNSQQEADQQIEYALSKGVNFIDTAEAYSIPVRPETYGATETIIGNWLRANSQKREQIVLASKIVGKGVPHIRDGVGLNGADIKKALDDSLSRLQTDCIDLYQLHWPNRQFPHFGNHWPGTMAFSKIDATEQQELFLQCLQALDDCIKAGKIRHFGLSNETPWGINEYLRLADKHSLPKPVSIQNEFNLLRAGDDPYLLETCVLNNIAYLPWSPIAGGALSGKYLNGARPEGSRWTFMQRNGIFRDTDSVDKAVAAYQKIAQKHGLSVVQMALAWVNQVDGVSSTIIGATSMAQLEENIAAFDLILDKAVLDDIKEVLRQYPMPF